MTIWDWLIAFACGGATVWAIMDIRLQRMYIRLQRRKKLLDDLYNLTQGWLKWSEPFNPGDYVYIDMEGIAKKVEVKGDTA